MAEKPEVRTQVSADVQRRNNLTGLLLGIIILLVCLLAILSR